MVRSRQGNIIIIGSVDTPMIEGQMKEANRFSFISSLMGMEFQVV